MELLNTPRHLTNTPTDAPTEASTPPPGWTDQLWVPEQVLRTAALCRAILRYRQANPELSDAMKAWTDHLMPSIEAFAHVTPNNLPPISIDDYNSIVHLAWVQPFTDRIEQYRESPDIAPTVGTHYCLAVGNDEGLELDETDKDEELCESDVEEVEEYEGEDVGGIQCGGGRQENSLRHYSLNSRGLIYKYRVVCA